MRGSNRGGYGGGGPPKQAKPVKFASRNFREGNAYGDDWPETRRIILQRDNYTCQRCGVTHRPPKHGKLHVHHIMPLGWGGGNAHSNLQTLCHPCHARVHELLNATRSNSRLRRT